MLLLYILLAIAVAALAYESRPRPRCEICGNDQIKDLTLTSAGWRCFTWLGCQTRRKVE